MTVTGFSADPPHDSYDIVIIGGGIMGTSAAWSLAADPGFDGRILVIERDPSYARAATMLAASCIRQQFSEPLNIRMSQYAAQVIADLPGHLDGHPSIPQLAIRNFGYLTLATNARQAAALRAAHAVQRACGAGTALLTPDEIAVRYPFYALDDVHLGALNTRDEGYWDAALMFEATRRAAIRAGVHATAGEVTGLRRGGGRVSAVHLASGAEIACGTVINAAGTRAAQIAAMAGIALPIEPRKRYSWVFRAAQPLPCALPLTVDPTGVYVREQGGGLYQCGSAGLSDPAVDPDDFAMDHTLWENHVWPILAARIPAFEAIRVQSDWVGHYDMNVLDHNALIGPHPDVPNLHMMAGFSGHGLQQAPAMGRAIAERIVHGRYVTLDLSPFETARVVEGRAVRETAVI